MIGPRFGPNCPAGKFQWQMLKNTDTANTPKITLVANTGIMNRIKLKYAKLKTLYLVLQTMTLKSIIK